jgi:CBS domain-containing protein
MIHELPLAGAGPLDLPDLKGDEKMQFTVKDWMIDLVVYVDPDSTVAEALALMRRRYIHSLIVNQKEDYPDHGILTSTDICDKIVAANRNPSTTRVREICTAPLITVRPTMSLQECAAVMHEHRFHHLPVEDENGNLVGMVSATDFLVAAESMGRADGDRIE